MDQYFLTALPFIMIVLLYFAMSFWRSKQADRLLKMNRQRLEEEREKQLWEEAQAKKSAPGSGES